MPSITRANRNKKRRTEGDNVDNLDDDTVMHGNNSNESSAHKNVSFMLLRTEVAQRKVQKKCKHN